VSFSSGYPLSHARFLLVHVESRAPGPPERTEPVWRNMSPFSSVDSASGRRARTKGAVSLLLHKPSPSPVATALLLNPRPGFDPRRRGLKPLFFCIFEQVRSEQ
jgi:hypothetical protein